MKQKIKMTLDILFSFHHFKLTFVFFLSNQLVKSAAKFTRHGCKARIWRPAAGKCRPKIPACLSTNFTSITQIVVYADAEDRIKYLRFHNSLFIKLLKRSNLLFQTN